MTFKEFLSFDEDFKSGTRDYKKRRLGAITGRAKEARGSLVKHVNPANLGKPDVSNPYGVKIHSMTIAGPDFRKKSYFQHPVNFNRF